MGVFEKISTGDFLQRIGYVRRSFSNHEVGYRSHKRVDALRSLY